MGIKTIVTLSTIALGFFIGSQFVLQKNDLSNLASADTQFIRFLPNRDIKFELSDPYNSQIWDYGMEGQLCFNGTPPSNNAKFRVELVMKLKGKTNPAQIVEEVIGASVTENISNPFTLDCNSARLRKAGFTAVMNIPAKNRWTEECPEILVKVAASGPWDKIPQPEVAVINRSFLCPNGQQPTAVPTSAPTSTPAPTAVSAPTNEPTSIPTTQPTNPPAQPTSAPQPTAIPQPTARPSFSITGSISTFSCTKPEKVQLTFCDEQKTKCDDLPFTSGPSTHGVWLEDVVEDRTFRYRYSISDDPFGNDIDQNKKYMIDKAFALFSETNKTVMSLKLDKNIVEPGKDRDLTISASDQTCTCNVHAAAQVFERNSNGDLIRTNALDRNGSAEIIYGITNDLSLIRENNPNNNPLYQGKPVLGFTDGISEVNSDYSAAYKPFPYGPYGKDAQTYVRLFAPGYDVVGQICESNGETHSCPEESYFWEKSFPTVQEENKNFRGLRITCESDISYGWIIQRGQGLASTNTLEQIREGILKNHNLKLDDIDFNKDGTINAADLIVCIDEWGSSGENLECDLIDNNIVDSLDYSIITSVYGNDVAGN